MLDSVVVSEDFLLCPQTEEDLKRAGFSEEDLDLIRGDEHQEHPRKDKGYLGILALNCLIRHGINSVPHDLPVSAFLFGEVIGRGFDYLIGIKEGSESVVKKQEVEGERDFFIPLNKAHLFSYSPRKGDTLTDLATEYARTHDLAIRERISEKAQPLCRKLAEMRQFKSRGQGDVDDMTQDGNFGLLDAIEDFDPGRGVKFETYASQRIRGAILDGLRGVDHLSRLDRAKVQRLEGFVSEYFEKYNSLPSSEEMRQFWEGGGEGDFEVVYDLWEKRHRETSLQKTLFLRDNNKELTIADNLPDDSADTMRGIYARELLEQLELDLQAIPERDREMLREHLLSGVQLHVLAAERGISESRASQLQTMYLEDKFYFKRTRAYLGIRDETIQLKIKID